LAADDDAARLRGRTIDDIRPGTRAGRSWILLFGLIPVDYDDLGIAELEPGRRFLERSTMLSMGFWEHERLAGAIVAFLFRHRHRRLADLCVIRASAPASRRRH
jgi:hypothetical protein